MLFRNENGKIIEMYKYNFLTDKEFYRKVMHIKGIKLETKERNQTNNSNAIKNLLK